MEVVKTYIVKINDRLTTLYLLTDGSYVFNKPTMRHNTSTFTSELEVISAEEAKTILSNEGS